MRTDSAWQRYSRQILFDPIGEEGQRSLSKSRVVLFGCGALGGVLANTLVRAGVGSLRICDRDFIELNNLQRQCLFDEDDIKENRAKAEAAAKKLSRVNREVEVDACVVDVNHTNIERLSDGADLLLDGTDNFETRYLINDLAVSTGRPWVYGAVVGVTGLVMTIVPGETPCLRCVFPEAPPAEGNPTCDTAGVLAPAVGLVAGFQAMEAMKLLAGRRDAVIEQLLSIDAWTGRVVPLNVQSTREGSQCPCCHRKNFDFLEGRHASTAAALCGRDAVQINTDREKAVNFSSMAAKLEPVCEGSVQVGKHMLRVRLDTYDVTLFADGRAIIKGTDDTDRARSLYAKYFGA